MSIIFWMVTFGCLTGYIAHTKGRNVFFWGAMGALIFILALPAALLAKPLNRHASPGSNTPTAQPEPIENSSGRYPCPHCAESIKREARFCRYCHLEVAPAS